MNASRTLGWPAGGSRFARNRRAKGTWASESLEAVARRQVRVNAERASAKHAEARAYSRLKFSGPCGHAEHALFAATLAATACLYFGAFLASAL